MTEVLKMTDEPFAFLGSVKEGCPSKDELELLSKKVGLWWPLGRRLKFDDAELIGFDKDSDVWSEKAFAMLRTWKQRYGSSATYIVLYDALCHEFVGRKDLAEKLCCQSD